LFQVLNQKDNKNYDLTREPNRDKIIKEEKNKNILSYFSKLKNI
jgi:hypothetical protein